MYQDSRKLSILLVFLPTTTSFRPFAQCCSSAPPSTIHCQIERAPLLSVATYLPSHHVPHLLRSPASSLSQGILHLKETLFLETIALRSRKPDSRKHIKFLNQPGVLLHTFTSPLLPVWPHSNNKHLSLDSAFFIFSSATTNATYNTPDSACSI